MLLGCLFSFACYLALSFVYYLWLAQTFDSPENWIGALVAGFATFCCIGALLNAWKAAKDRSLLKYSHDHWPPSDGRLIAAAGVIVPAGDPVIAPFSGTKCVLCEYEIQTTYTSDGKTREQTEYSGFTMNPCVVRTPQGEVAVLGFPSLDDIPSRIMRDVYYGRRALAYLRMAEFQDVSGIKLIGALTALKDVWCDDDGHIRKDLRLRSEKKESLFSPELEEHLDSLPVDLPRPKDDDYEDDDDDLNEGLEDTNLSEREQFSLLVPRLSEKLIAPGEHVCVIGRYDAERQGLVPSSSGRGRLNRLIRGKPEVIEKRLHSSLWTNLVGALIVLPIIHLIIFGVITLYRFNPKEQAKRHEKAVQAVRAGDVQQLEVLAARGVDLKAADSDGKTLLLEAKDPAMVAYLIAAGVDINAADKEGNTPLREAARAGEVDIVKQLIAAGADLNARHKEYRTTALMAADGSQKAETAALLRAAGAFDDVVTEKNGTPLIGDGGAPLAAVLAYLKALHDNDLAGFRAQMSNEQSHDFTLDDMHNWQGSHVKELEEAEGFANDKYATVRIRGVTGQGGGFRATWDYQLVLEDGQWKVLRSNWIVP